MEQLKQNQIFVSVIEFFMQVLFCFFTSPRDSLPLNHPRHVRRQSCLPKNINKFQVEDEFSEGNYGK